MKRIICLLLLLCFTANSFAATAGVKNLEKIMDDFHYTITVEWDQKDQSFYDKQSDLFLAKIAAQMTESGLSKEDLLTLAENKMNDKKTFEALKFKLSLLKKDLTSEELSQTLKDSSKEFYKAGASWNGDVTSYAFIGVFILLIGYGIWFEATHECVQYEEVYSCETYTYCRQYDSYGNCTWYGSDEDCGYVSTCKQYVKK